MNVFVAIGIIAIGSFCQSSSYVPINKVKKWSWECFWLIQGVFAWLVFPYIGASLAVPEGSSLGALFLSADSVAVWKTIGYGFLWGVGGLTFGLSMRYLGVALGQSISLGTCSAFGTIIPALFFDKQDLLHGPGLMLLIGVSVTIAGIAVIGYAGVLRSQNMTDEEKKAAVKDFALTKGLLVALLSGVMSACFALGLSSGTPIAEAAKAGGASDLYATLPSTFLVTLGGFFTNAIYCLYQNYKNNSFKDYVSISGGEWINNLLYCALAGILWYSQFFGLALGKSFIAGDLAMLAFSWCILMSFNVIFSNVWGIILKEWKGVNKKTIAILITGIIILIFSTFIMNI